MQSPTTNKVFLLFLICHWGNASPTLGEVDKRQANPAITFYEKAYCEGASYTILLGNGDCQSVPQGIWGWNLSIQTMGYCVMLFESGNCGGNTRYQSYNEKYCKSTKLYGLNTVRSFRRLNC